MSMPTNLIEIFCPGRILRSHTGKIGFIHTSVLIPIGDRYPYIQIFWIDGDKPYSFLYFLWLYEKVVDENMFTIYDRVLTYTEIDALHISYNKHGFKDPKIPNKDDVAFVEKMVENCPEIILRKDTIRI